MKKTSIRLIAALFTFALMTGCMSAPVEDERPMNQEEEMIDGGGGGEVERKPDTH